jgi:hypothetical protein
LKCKLLAILRYVPILFQQLKIEEFGISAREALSADILLKNIAYENDTPTNI